jgi:3-phosphoshikimate 1-carboxyvinyltransferase
MQSIEAGRFRGGAVRVPGSKSYTHRALIAAALGRGSCLVLNALESEDTVFTRRALAMMGARLEQRGQGLLVHGVNGHPAACNQPVSLGNSGTSMRLLAAVSALGQGTYTLTGSSRMRQRPIGDLLTVLRALGVPAQDLLSNGCPPITIVGGHLRGGEVSVNCSQSSQFLSALLLTAPLTPLGMTLTVSHGPVSRPYIDLTVAVMQSFGVQLSREGYGRFMVPGGQMYTASEFTVEPDCSQAGYFWAAAAISGQTVTVVGISPASRQGDAQLLGVLEAMGCRVSHRSDGVAVTGGALRAVDVDMQNMPDVVPTLAVVAAFARGTTVMRGIAHLRHKESDRLAVVAERLGRLGITARVGADSLVVEGGSPHGAMIDPADDHRIAMSFALAGLQVPGVAIAHPDCVAKSFPRFWETLETLMP